MHVQEAITIDRPIDEVFAYLADVERNPEWTSSVLEVSKTSSGPMDLGATFVEDAKFLGRREELKWEISAYEPPYIIERWATSGPARLTIRTTLEATPGGTRLTMTHRGETGDLWEVADVLVARSLRKQVAADLETLKILVEKLPGVCQPRETELRWSHGHA